MYSAIKLCNCTMYIVYSIFWITMIILVVLMYRIQGMDNSNFSRAIGKDNSNQ